jgi:hypothetical protein
MTASEDSFFRYQPLDLHWRNLRLLRILPTTKNGMIQCDVEIRDFPSPATYAFEVRDSYNTLSYEWGPPHPSHRILLNGKYFIVRENLSRFLHMARERFAAEPDFRQFLWIDAICIDQENIPERDNQVCKMRDIYAYASTVLIWLGPSSTQVDAVSEEMLIIGNRLEAIYRKNQSSSRSPFCNNRLSDDFLTCRMLDRDSELFPAFLELCNRSYWERMWIIQEVYASVNARLIVGNHAFPWTLIKRTLRSPLANLVKEVQSTPAARLVKVIGTPFQECLGWSLVQLAAKLGRGKCFDGRDKIYSIVGILPNYISRRFHVDYSISREQLFVRVIAHDFDTRYDLISSKIQGGRRVITIQGLSDADITRSALGISFNSLYEHLADDSSHESAPISIRLAIKGVAKTHPQEEKEYSFILEADRKNHMYSIERLDLTVCLEKEESRDQFTCRALCETTSGTVHTYESSILGSSTSILVEDHNHAVFKGGLVPLQIFLFLMAAVSTETIIQLQEEEVVQEVVQFEGSKVINYLDVLQALDGKGS